MVALRWKPLVASVTGVRGPSLIDLDKLQLIALVSWGKAECHKHSSS